MIGVVNDTRQDTAAGTARTSLRVPGGLAADALRRSGLPAGTTLAGLAWFALAKLAGWPDPAARLAAGHKAGKA
jgi:hypothetical protein